MAEMVLFIYLLNSSIMDWVVVGKLVCVTEDEVEEAIASVVVSLEVGRSDHVSMEGDMLRSKYWLGF